MSGRVIPLREPGCAQVQELLPWLVSGGLPPAEEAQARAHIANCPSCHGELEVEERLREAVSDLPTQTDIAWRAFRSKLEPARAARSSRTWVGWAIAAQFLLLVGGAALFSAPRPAAYHALGAGAAPSGANMLVMFRPETSEAGMRALLRAAHARVVDGPTETGAYLLAAPTAERAQALAALGASPDITVAQPIDSGAGP